MNINRLIASLMAFIALGGCSSCTKSQPKELVLLAIDYSGSTESVRKQLLAKSLELATELDASNTHFVLYRFASSVQEVYSGVPEDESTFANELKKAAGGSDPIEGTQYPKLLKELALRASTATDASIKIIIVGDGGNDFAGDPTYDAMISDAASSLQANPKVSYIRLVGVETGSREAWTKLFGGTNSKLQFRLFSQDSDD